MAFGLFWLAWILWTVLDLGLSGLSASLFTEMTPPPGADTGSVATYAVRVEAGRLQLDASRLLAAA